MSVFKLKPDKMKHSENIHTLDGAHKKIVEKFEDQRNSLPKKKKKLSDLHNELGILEKKHPSTYTIDDIRKKSQIKTDIKKIEDEIYDIENNVSEIEYYSATGEIIIDYYDIIDDKNNNLVDQDQELLNEPIQQRKKKIDNLDRLNMINKENKKYKKVSKRRKKNNTVFAENNILNYFDSNKEDDKNKENTEPKTENKEENDDDSENENSLRPNLGKTVNRKQLLDEYLSFVDINYVSEKKKFCNTIKTCSRCNKERTLIQAEGRFVCVGCGETESVIVESEKPNYKDSGTQEKAIYAYKRQNHFNEWLSQFQAKESTEITDDLKNIIIAELHKQKIYSEDYKNLKLSKIKEILKKLNMTQYYEHATHIISKLSGMPPPTISRDIEEKFRLMFKKIQAPFDKHCPKTRINFLSYSYVLHKFCQLLELDEYVDCFPLLKNKDKLRLQDKVWEKICFDLRWQYISSED